MSHVSRKRKTRDFICSSNHSAQDGCIPLFDGSLGIPRKAKKNVDLRQKNVRQGEAILNLLGRLDFIAIEETAIENLKDAASMLQSLKSRLP